MIIKKVLLKNVIANLGDMVINVYGSVEGKSIDNIADMQRVNALTLDWVNPVKNNQQEIAEASKAHSILVGPNILYSETLKSQGKTLIVVDNPKKALILTISKFFSPKFTPSVDPTAVIHPEAIIGKNNYIGPNCYIGKCVIGDNNVIHSNVSIYDRTIIGNNNTIHSGALICVDGLGCIRECDGSLLEFPQLGGVIIGSNIYLGGGIHIASGSLSDTIIEDGCKLNGLCFIGSNDHLHKNVWITGATMLAGSVDVGENTTIFSRVVVRDWCSIGANCTIGMGSVVTKNVPDGEIWVGSPAHKFEKKS